MPEIARFEVRRTATGRLVATALLSAYALAMLAFFPSIQASAVDFQRYLDSLPPEVRATLLRGVADLTTIEGFLVAEFYQFVWTLLLGVYVTYVGSMLVVGERERGSLDVLLAGPVTRARVVLGKYGSLVPTVLLLNLVVPVVVGLGTWLIGEPVTLRQLVLVHAFSVPYLLAVGALGTLLSVVADRADRARNAAISLPFGLYLFDTVLSTTDYGWVGAVSPTRYYRADRLFVESAAQPAEAAVLLGMTAALLAVSVAVFRRRDLT